MIRVLVIFNFQTGSISCPYWQESFIATGEIESIEKLEDCFSSRLKNKAFRKKSYIEIAEDVMNDSELEWERPLDTISSLDGFKIINVK